MKKDLAKVKAYAKAMMDSNHMRDAYINKEQDKFFCCLNQQRSNINGLKEHLEWLELRVKALCHHHSHFTQLLLDSFLFFYLLRPTLSTFI